MPQQVLVPGQYLGMAGFIIIGPVNLLLSRLRTKMRIIASLVILPVGMLMPAFAGPVGITVIPSLSPNVFGSPSYAAYVANATHAIEHGLSSYGTLGTPSYYQRQSTITSDQAIVTGFPSWYGEADPATAFGTAYASELGNRPLFGLLVDGNGTKISISELGFSAVSDDPGNMLGFGFATGSYNYSNDYEGIIFGSGGPTYITSGSNTQLVDMIIGRGSGNALAAYCPGCTIAQQQAAIDAAISAMNTVSHFTGTYTLDLGTAGTVRGSGTFTNASAAPEPGTIGLMFGGTLALAGTIKRRRA